MAFPDWSTTASDNTTVGGVYIGEFCPSSNLNNMGREIMAELRAAFSPALAGFFASADLATARTALAAFATSGGIVTGGIIRSGAGAHTYNADPALSSGRIFFTASGAPQPTGMLPGDQWLTGS